MTADNFARFVQGAGRTRPALRFLRVLRGEFARRRRQMGLGPEAPASGGQGRDAPADRRPQS
jgi:hypothetical protein